MRLALVIRPFADDNLMTARQMGVEDVVTTLPHELQTGPVWDYLAIVRHKKRIEDIGLRWSVVESVSISNRIKLALDGRDEDIEHYCQTIRNLGAAGIPTMCYNWMAVFGWMRTSLTTRTRGGALASTYDHEEMKNAPLTEHGEVSEERLWENLEYFLKIVIPVAEEAGVKQGLHPDDPPLSPIRGISRIITSPEAFDRVFDIAPSDCNGITFCQGNFKAMGVDIPENIRHFGNQNKIVFAHFRDLHGQVPTFSESFHDDGDTDMASCIRAYNEVGFEGAIRPDHTPTFAIDKEETGGYNFLGRLYAIGYMKGLIHGTA
ncbi:MAG: mannonate dehydratase [bacterium]|nr:mannonate dehydratase [bacterium]